MESLQDKDKTESLWRGEEARYGTSRGGKGELTLTDQVPLASTPDEENLGELVISVPYVQRWCKQRGVKLHNRMVRLVAHGVCHCLGYDHEEGADAR